MKVGYLDKVNLQVKARPWKKNRAPKKVLAIRLQALGDTLITLPYLQDLKRQSPQLTLHMLTREEVCTIPKEMACIDRVITIGGGRNAKLQFVLMLFKIPYLIWQQYDIVLDLQNNRISRAARLLLFPTSWTEFDKSSPISAGERTRNTINALNVFQVNLWTDLRLKRKQAELVFKENATGANQEYDLVVLNPAGFFASRNWHLNNYIAFAKDWLKTVNANTYFVLLLMPALQDKARIIKDALGDSCIDLTGKANQLEAFSLIRKCKLVLTEDSGLMHMAWIQGIPTVALFSSSRKDWSAPQGAWSICLDSSDLECGPCMSEVCKFGDNRCLTRFSPAFVVEQAKHLLVKSI